MKEPIYPNLNPKLILSEISNLKPLNYNQFRWWRRFDQKSPKLPNKTPLIDKINNGDLEFSHFYWQALYCELELNQKSEDSIDGQCWLETTRLDRARRKKLWGDFEKDENNKLEYIKKEFIKEFFINDLEYDNIIISFDGGLKDLYTHCNSKYGKKIRSKSRRGRPSKN